MTDPSVVMQAPIYQINLTILLSVLGVAIAAMGTLVGIFRKKPKDEELPGKSQFCIQHKTEIERIEKETKESIKRLEGTDKENSKKHDDLKQLFNDLDKEIISLRNQSENNTKSLDEMKRAVREIATRLDDLLKQLMDTLV